MKKSELFLMAQKAVCESSLPKTFKLEVLGVLMDEMEFSKIVEDAAQKASEDTIDGKGAV